MYSQRLQSAVHECYELSKREKQYSRRDDILCIEKSLPIILVVTFTVVLTFAFLLFLSLLVVVGMLAWYLTMLFEQEHRRVCQIVGSMLSCHL